jgi:epoxyqueuosine reductase
MAPQGDASLTPARRAELVKERARALGFTRAGIADLTPSQHGDALHAWLAGGMAATMAYMERQATRRTEPAAILPGATRAVVVTRNYYSEDPPPPPPPPAAPRTGRVARYARGKDYHTALGQPLGRLADYVKSLGDDDVLARPYCDAGPVPERELAQRAGIGWVGKNTMLIDPREGSFFFLAVILTNLDVALDLPFEADRCGSCRRCLDACPTRAFPEERVLDSRRCISYLTIEHRGPLDPEAGAMLGDWVFGCDVCQEVCPWNVKFAHAAEDPALALDPALARLNLMELGRMTDAEFEQRYGRTALRRAGPEGMRRNARSVTERGLRDRRTSDFSPT